MGAFTLQPEHAFDESIACCVSILPTLERYSKLGDATASAVVDVPADDGVEREKPHEQHKPAASCAARIIFPDISGAVPHSRR